jgi:pimeloyl-ACP methyl ester carboxylesterase
MLDLGSFDLLGTSRGGAVAMMAAAASLSTDYSGPRLRRLILVCPVNPYSAHGRLLAPFFGTTGGAALFRWGTATFPQIYPYFHARLFADRRQIPLGSLQGYQAPMVVPGLFEHGLSIVRTWTEDLHELKAALPKLAQVPAFFMWGDKDPAVYLSSATPLMRHFHNSPLVVFPGIGHLPYEECAQEFNQALLQFLTVPPEPQ